VETLKKVVMYLVVLELVFVIHEYGHYTEFVKRNIPVQEFSLGIGPAIYQYQTSSLTLSFRWIPIVAYVAPTKDGYEIQKSSSFGDKFAISVVGVRNNLLSGVGAVLILNFISWRKGLIEGSQLLKRFVFYPIKIIWAFILFFVDTLTLRKFSIGKNFKLLTGYIHPPKPLGNFIFLSFILGFLNFMPFYPLDGGKTLIELASKFLDVKYLGITQTISQIAFYAFVFGFGVSDMKFVDYDEFE